MTGNSFGKNFIVTTFGESHGNALGCVIDGCPFGVLIDENKIQTALDRRKPNSFSNNPCVTTRSEQDKVEILSGVFNGKSTGTPICMIIRNKEQHSKDYENLKNTFRPGHADFTYDIKYNSNQDFRGGGRSSGRETVARVAAGAIANEILLQKGIKITAYTIRAAGISCKNRFLSQIEQNNLRVPDNKIATIMEEKIKELREKGESAGGIIECVVENYPIGLGNPVFDKLDAVLAHAMLSIGSIKGIEFGDGFSVADFFGSVNNDLMKVENEKIIFESNHSGGILGGISNGENIIFRVAVKPVPSIFVEQKTITKIDGKYQNTNLKIQGRHDVCLCPRIVPVVESMTALTLVDFLL